MTTQVGPYRVKGEIGRGGMGLVMLARDDRLQRDVAIKSLAPAFAEDAQLLARFRRESRIIAQLNHPHIAQVYHVLEQDGQLYLVLEFVPGRSLAEMIAQQGALDLETALDLCVQIARAMEAAHRQGIVHRDLKPANIRVTDDGIAKVLDFGIARVLGDEGVGHAGANVDPEATDIAPTLIVGTPGYMAPEQAEGRSVDARADIFSFGCILYECLTGVPVFPGATIRERLAAARTAEPDTSRLPVGLPDGVRGLLGQCLARKVDDRLPDMSGARVVLNVALGRQPTPTPHHVSGAGIADNLPAPTTSFVGRSQEMEQLSILLSDARLLTLTGPGGAGKTRLALELARRVRERFPDGVHLADLTSRTSPDSIPAAVAAALGVKDRAKTTTTEVLCEYFAARTTLLIIDNCEHVLDAVSQLITPLLRAAPSLRILATSREALKVPGEHIWPVPSLSLPGGDDPAEVLSSEAVALFTDRARSVRPAFELTEANVSAVARVCRRLDGIPLAIELAAAQVRVLTPEEIDGHLDDRLRLLALESHGVADRHSTLRAAMDWSYLALSDSEKRMLRALSVFAGGWTLSGAIAVCGPGGRVEDGCDLDDLGVIDLLTHLVDKSLVITESAGRESRYRLLETVRQYAAEQLDLAEESGAARGRHVDLHLSLAEGAGPHLSGGDQAALLARMEAEHDNMLAALDACDSIEGGAEKALRLCGALRWFWRMHGHFKTGFEACNAALARPGGRAPAAARAGALLAAAGMALSLGDYEGTTTLATEALGIEQGLGNRDGVARTLNTLGNAAYYRGDLAEAQRRHEESLSIRREQGDGAGIATSLNNLGNVASDRGRRAEARRLYKEAIQINREAGNRDWEAINLNNLGLMAFFANDLGEARQLHEESLAIRRDLADRQGIAESLNHLGKMARHEGDFTRARHLHEQSLSIRRDIGDRLGMADSLDDTAMLAARLDAFELAARLLGAAEHLREEIKSPRRGPEQEEVELGLTPARDAIGQHDFIEVVRAGRQLSLEEVTIAALSWLAADRSLQ